MGMPVADLILQSLVAFARCLFQFSAVQYSHSPPPVRNQSRLLQDTRRDLAAYGATLRARRTWTGLFANGATVFAHAGDAPGERHAKPADSVMGQLPETAVIRAAIGQNRVYFSWFSNTCCENPVPITLRLEGVEDRRPRFRKRLAGIQHRTK